MVEYVEKYGSMEIAEGVYRATVTVATESKGRRMVTAKLVHEADEASPYSAHQRAEGQYLLYAMRGRMPGPDSGCNVLSVK